MESSCIMEHGNNFSGSNFFGKIVIDTGKPSTEYRNSFIVLLFQSIELSKL
jgi:hypothetical protein